MPLIGDLPVETRRGFACYAYAMHISWIVHIVHMMLSKVFVLTQHRDGVFLPTPKTPSSPSIQFIQNNIKRASKL